MNQADAAKLKFDCLKKNLQSLGSVLIAFSGGVDSTFLAKAAHDVLGKNAISVTATSSTYPKRELREAKRIAKQIGIRQIIIESEETEIDNFSRNPKDRCYYCKKELFKKLKDVARKNGVKHILDGTNYDDMDDYRPGMRAIKEENIVSPLKDAKLTKEDIRILSKDMGLATWDKPSCACLASRFPYGTEITKERLEIIDKAESIIKNIGIKQVRVRYHDNIARIEVEREFMPLLLEHSEKIIPGLKDIGFTYIAVDLEGYRTGSMNEVLKDGN